MGYIDCDAHVLENDSTWNFLDPDEREFRPQTFRCEDVSFEQWSISEYRIARMDRVQPVDGEKFDRIYPEGAGDLSNVPGRLDHLSQLGIENQVLFSTFFIQADFRRPLIHA